MKHVKLVKYNLFKVKKFPFLFVCKVKASKNTNHWKKGDTMDLNMSKWCGVVPYTKFGYYFENTSCKLESLNN